MTCSQYLIEMTENLLVGNYSPCYQKLLNTWPCDENWLK
ncbi:hypothetical protein Avbf_14665 [Armadillidium vulgare]|nr:hypothetical protein Avbf_14665 [Armadillidium vulgare]